MWSATDMASSLFVQTLENYKLFDHMHEHRYIVEKKTAMALIIPME